MPKPLIVWITINCGKFWKRWEYQITWPSSWEICMQVRKQQLELDLEQQTGCKEEKEYVKAVYCHPAYLSYMQCTSWEMLGWRKHKLESRLLGEISVTSDMQMTPLLKWRGTKQPFDESERGEWKSWLKTQHSKVKVMASGPITSWQIDEKQWKQWQTLFFWVPKSMQMVTAAKKLKDTSSLEQNLWPTKQHI